jgi:ABC-type nitrate/sulfonate/bicarbonate transport system ATPase subunit
VTASAALELDRIGKVYPTPSGPAVIVKDVDLVIEKGELVSLIGHSGCGKSTILSMVAGLTGVTSGVIRVGGSAIDGPGPDRGVVFQSPCLFPWLSALDNVVMGLDEVYQNESRMQRLERAKRALDVVGLADAYRIRPAAMSAGMRQRVALARAFALTPRTLLLDEPFGMLDSITRAELQDLLLEMRDVCPTTLLVTHDIDEALLLSDRIAVMTNGPAASVRAVIDIPFRRPRDRSVGGSTEWHRLREQILGLLETA